MPVQKRAFPFHSFKLANRTLLVAALLCILAVLAPYVYFSGGGISSEQKHWTNFSTWVGGTLGPSLSFLALCAALLTSYFQTRSREADDKRAKKERRERKRLVQQLLRDEFEKRYFGDMRPALMRIRECDDAQGKRLGLLNLQLRDDDLIVAANIASRFPDFYFLEDPELISEAINVHVRLRDLRDIQQTLFPAPHQRELDEYGNVPGSTTATQQIDATIDKLNASIAQVQVKLRQIGQSRRGREGR